MRGTPRRPTHQQQLCSAPSAKFATNLAAKELIDLAERYIVVGPSAREKRVRYEPDQSQGEWETDDTWTDVSNACAHTVVARGVFASMTRALLHASIHISFAIMDSKQRLGHNEIGTCAGALTARTRRYFGTMEVPAAKQRQEAQNEVLQSLDPDRDGGAIATPSPRPAR
ncbi:hypothetical protein EDB85DRAFT_1893602 [Lactarius pseudohatsudake]|nr:hypothetical protein EDB85DRAFT_1893602 [Lactarius pseudohatsudake]